MNPLKKIALVAVFWAVPAFALAATSQTLTDIINKATHIVTIYTVGLVGITAYVFWLVGNIIWTSGNAEKRKQASQQLVWAVISIFVFVTVGAIVATLYNTFFGSTSLTLPK